MSVRFIFNTKWFLSHQHRWRIASTQRDRSNREWCIDNHNIYGPCSRSGDESHLITDEADDGCSSAMVIIYALTH